MRYYLGIDLGGTNVKGVLLAENGNIVGRLQVEIQNFSGKDNWKKAVAKCAEELTKLKPVVISAIGISAPGIPNKENTAIACMPGRLEGLENFNWGNFLQIQTVVVNDAVAALTAELYSGAAKGSTNAVMVTLGTGVGGALLINGKPFQGSFQKAGHIGHIVIDSSGNKDITGMPGSLEDCIGNWNISERSNGRFSSTHELLKEVKRENQEAKTIWLTSVKKLAIGLASVSNIISPDRIIVGGGIAEANEELFVPLIRWFHEFDWQPAGNKPEIVKAIHQEMAGAIGAAYFASDFNKSGGHK